MFKWYENAQVCYVYLGDVPNGGGNPYHPDSMFRSSQWFTRGWTLQELLAPSRVEFYDRGWEEIGTKGSLKNLVESITGITHLLDHSTASVAQKMSWASTRKTTIKEDEAYCLLGLFDANMPLLYGEGRKAFTRLQIEIINSTENDSIFAWEGPSDIGLLAKSSLMFKDSGDIIHHVSDAHRLPHSATSKGVRLEGAVTYLEAMKNDQQVRRLTAPINCARIARHKLDKLALVLYQDKNSTLWKRESTLATASISERKTSTIYVPQIVYMQDRDFKKLLQWSTDVSVEFPSLSQSGIRLKEIYTSKNSVPWSEQGADRLQVSFQDQSLTSVMLRFQAENSSEVPTFVLIITQNMNGIWLDLIYSDAPLSQIKMPETTDLSWGSDRISEDVSSESRASVNAMIRRKRVDGSSKLVVTVVFDKTGLLSWRSPNIL
jgi:uncharacterized protein YdbL (DUF1318 family)